MEIISGSVTTVDDAHGSVEIRLPTTYATNYRGGKKTCLVLHRVEIECSFDGATDADTLDIEFTLNEKDAIVHLNEKDLICKFSETILHDGTAASARNQNNIRAWAPAPRILIDDNSLYMNYEIDGGVVTIYYRIFYTMRTVPEEDLKKAFRSSRSA